MTWWEVEQMAGYIEDLEQAMDEWSLSGPQMRREQQTIDTLIDKIQRRLEQGDEDDRKAFLMQLTEHVEQLRQQLAERLKRDLPDRR
ncbi:MAG: hypothetical protein OEV87_11530 [Phycisphaerae bacterium]|nr:hypothetical protein [Phycisphaerae bacterium]